MSLSFCFSLVSVSVDSGCDELSENVWFVWSKTSYSGDVTDAGQITSKDRATQLLSCEKLSLAILCSFVSWQWIACPQTRLWVVIYRYLSTLLKSCLLWLFEDLLHTLIPWYWLSLNYYGSCLVIQRLGHTVHILWINFPPVSLRILSLPWVSGNGELWAEQMK